MGWMLIRLVLSLLFVAAVLLFAARVAKKRGLGGGALVQVLARQPISRGGSVNVVRVGDRVFLLGTTEAQISLLAEMDAAAVDEALEAATAAPQPADGSSATPVKAKAVLGTGFAAGSVFDRTQWSAVLEGMRDRTVRRG